MLWKAIERAKLHNSGGRVSVFSIAVDKRNRALAQEGNSYVQTHPTMAKFATKAGLVPKQYLHSEVKCLLRALRSSIVVNKLYVARVDRDGNVKDGKPCTLCRSYIAYVEEIQGSKIDVIYSKENVDV